MLTLPWFATFEDGTSLAQYENMFDQSYSKENTFSKVLERQDELVGFCLVNQQTGVGYEVDLINGCIYTRHVTQPRLEARADMLRKDDLKYRLIYFREVERTFGQDLSEIGEPKILYFLGFQYTDTNGKNHKRIMRIKEDGTTVVN